MSCFVKMKQSRPSNVFDIILAKHVQDVVQLLGITEVFVVEKRLVRPVALNPEIQDVEALAALIQQIIQGFRQGVWCVHSEILDEGIAEDADVGGGGKVGFAEIPVLAEGEIVVMPCVGRVAIRARCRISRIRLAGPYPPCVPTDLCFRQMPILRRENPHGYFA